MGTLVLGGSLAPPVNEKKSPQMQHSWLFTYNTPRSGIWMFLFPLYYCTTVTFIHTEIPAKPRIFTARLHLKPDAKSRTLNVTFVVFQLLLPDKAPKTTTTSTPRDIQHRVLIGN